MLTTLRKNLKIWCVTAKLLREYEEGGVFHASMQEFDRVVA